MKKVEEEFLRRQEMEKKLQEIQELIDMLKGVDNIENILSSFIDDIKIGNNQTLSDILNLILEVNKDIFSNSYNYHFELFINNLEYNYALITTESLFSSIKNEKDIKSITIKLEENLGYYRSVSVIYTELDKITKEKVLEWMTDTIFKEFYIN